MQTVTAVKGLSQEISTFFCGGKWIYLGLNWNRFWFFNFKDAPSILDSHFKFRNFIPNLLADS
jgi:hypothetical protein